MFTHTDIRKKENIHGNGPQIEYKIYFMYSTTERIHLQHLFDVQYYRDDTFAAMYVRAHTHPTIIEKMATEIDVKQKR